MKYFILIIVLSVTLLAQVKDTPKDTTINPIPRIDVMKNFEMQIAVEDSLIRYHQFRSQQLIIQYQTLQQIDWMTKDSIRIKK